ncbi:hypothetical protein [Roseimarinus sediminis]|uniref:hypothetical protein n=1 Tax=Roseimarinus sediminis TaxID=1610899 RepID=UPI003D208A84
MRENNKNKFNDPVSIKWDIFYTIFWLAIVVFMFVFIVPKSEEELLIIFGDVDLVGTSRQRASDAIQAFIINHFGKTGYIVFISILSLIIIDQLFKWIYSIIRYKRKLNLFRNGIVTDLNDYSKKVGLFGFIWQKMTQKDKANIRYQVSPRRIKRKTKHIDYDKFK